MFLVGEMKYMWDSYINIMLFSLFLCLKYSDRNVDKIVFINEKK